MRLIMTPSHVYLPDETAVKGKMVIEHGPISSYCNPEGFFLFPKNHNGGPVCTLPPIAKVKPKIQGMDSVVFKTNGEIWAYFEKTKTLIGDWKYPVSVSYHLGHSPHLRQREVDTLCDATHDEVLEIIRKTSDVLGVGVVAYPVYCCTKDNFKRCLELQEKGEYDKICELWLKDFINVHDTANHHVSIKDLPEFTVDNFGKSLLL